MIRRSMGVYEPICDRCGAVLPEEFDFGDALDAVKAAGWQSISPDEGNGYYTEHYCPECQAGRYFA